MISSVARRLGILGSTLALMAAGGLVYAAAADAAVFTCTDSQISTKYCAKVTAIDSGSYLAVHLGPNYTSGTTGGKFHNGYVFGLGCWTTGAGDADGHGDHYWFRVDSDAAEGYVNDWYLTTGSYSQWSAKIKKCP